MKYKYVMQIFLIHSWKVKRLIWTWDILRIQIHPYFVIVCLFQMVFLYLYVPSVCTENSFCSGLLREIITFSMITYFLIYYIEENSIHSVYVRV
jgi:hypothetical protein